MTIELINPDLIDPSPWQTRVGDDSAHIQSLVAELAAGRRLPVPLARPSPTAPGRYQLAYHHSCFQAQKLFAPGQPVYLELVDLTDEQMSEEAITENAKRKDLNPVEKALALQRHIRDFHKTQAQAGALMDLDQSSVSNLLGLLDFPEKLQEMVGAGRLPLRFAWKLKTVAKYWPDRAVNAGGAIANHDEDQRDDAANNELSTIWASLAIEIERLPWDWNWKPDPTIYAEILPAAKGAPELPRVCKGCPDLQTYSKTKFCALVACYRLKEKVYARRELARVAKKTEIPAGDGKAKPVFDSILHYSDELTKARKLLERKPAGLALVERQPAGKSWEDQVYTDLFGSPFVTIAAEDPKAILKTLELPAVEARKLQAPELSERVREREAEAKTERAVRRAIFHRAKADIIWMLANLAHSIADQLQIAGPILEECEEELTERDHIPQGAYEEIHAHKTEIEKEIRRLDKEGQAERVALLRREHILYMTFASPICDGGSAYGAKKSDEINAYVLPDARDQIAQRVEDLGLKAPKGWDVPPIHRTEFNCWTCGTFAPGENLTQKDVAEGWRIEHNGKATTAVYCPDCRPPEGPFVKDLPESWRAPLHLKFDIGDPPQPVKVDYTPSAFVDKITPDSDVTIHFEFHGEATSETGYHSYFTTFDLPPKGETPEIHARKQAESFYAELHKKAKGKKAQPAKPSRKSALNAPGWKNPAAQAALAAKSAKGKRAKK